MEYNLVNKVVERKTKEIYKDGDKIIKLFVENYSKADVLNEALNQARVEEGTDLYMPKLIEVTKISFPSSFFKFLLMFKSILAL